MTNTDEVFQLATQLPANERADLVRRLTLTIEPTTLKPTFDEDWADEIEARLAAYDRGESVASDWSEVEHRLRNELRKDSAA